MARCSGDGSARIPVQLQRVAPCPYEVVGVQRRGQAAVAARRIEVHLELAHEVAVLEYVGPADDIGRFAEAMLRRGYVVIVDTALRDDLHPLPCRRLWQCE